MPRPGEGAAEPIDKPIYEALDVWSEQDWEIVTALPIGTDGNRLGFMLKHRKRKTKPEPRVMCVDREPRHGEARMRALSRSTVRARTAGWPPFAPRTASANACTTRPGNRSGRS